MTDAVLRFLVELEDHGLTKLQAGLKSVAKTSTTTAATATKAGSQQTAAIDRVVIAEASARKRSVENAAARIAAARRQVDAYKAIGAAAVVGSDEQIAADALAAKAAQRLARDVELSAGRTRVAYAGAGHGVRTFERDLERSGRGALAASGLFRGMGRSLAFASTAFLGGAGIIFGLKSVYDQSTHVESVQKSLRTQLDSTGISWSKYGKEIDAVTAKDAYLAGIEDTDTKAALTSLIRTTGSLAAAEKLLGLATDVSAGAHVPLATAAKIVGNIFSGNIGIAKRYGIVLGSDVKTPLEALIRLQEKFAGQAAAAGDTTAGAFGRAQASLHSFESGFGSGALPVIADELNKLTGAISNPELEQSAQHLGETIATNVGDAINGIVSDVRKNWPVIKQDFHDAEQTAKLLAHSLETVAGMLQKIANILPAKGSIFSTLIETVLLSKGLGKLGKFVLGGKGAAAEGEKAAPGLLARIPGVAKGAALLAAPEVTVPVAAGSVLVTKLVQDYLATHDLGASKGRGGLAGRVLEKDGRFFVTSAQNAGRGGPGGEREISAAKAAKLLGIAIDGVTNKTDRATEAEKRHGDAATQSWTSVRDAIKASGGDLDRQKSKLDQVVKSEQAAARATAQLLSAAFSRATGNIDTAFDAQTQQLVDNISYRVDLVGKSIHEAFTLKGDEKTPAERELAALDKLQQRRTFGRDITKARKDLESAQAIGDPTAIKNAQQALEDAQTAKRRYGLEQRATLERAAADKAKARAQKQLQASRDVEKQRLDDALAAIAKSVEKGKLAGDKALKDILKVLGRHGVDFKTAGQLLGSAFADQLQQNLDLVRTRADRVHTAFDKIADTKKRIKELTDQVAKLAIQLQKVQKGGVDAFLPTKAEQAANVKHHASGGVIGGTGTGDTVPALLTPGEIVLNRRQQRGLAAKLGYPGLTGHALFGLVQRFAGGGVVDDLLEVLARNSLRVENHPKTSPLSIESLVNHSRAGSGSRDDRLALMAKLAQAQAHPLTAGFFNVHPDTPATLGQHPHLLAAGGGGVGGVTFTGDITITLEDKRNARENAKAIRRELEKTGRANAATRRGPFAGKRIGLD